VVVCLRDERLRSVSRACRTAGISRAGFRYIPRRAILDEPIREAISEFVARFSRRGLPRLQDWLTKSGHAINHKRTARIYREMGMQVRKRRRKRFGRVPKIVRPVPTRPNEVWSMDFVHDWLMTNRKLKCLTVVDDFTKSCVGILVGHAIGGEAVGNFLGSRGSLPERLRSDNGPEFQSNALRAWVESVGITHDFITPGKPNENAFVESFNSRFRDECLNEHVFRSLDDARRKIESWRSEDYNELHPHSSLGMKSPNEFAKTWEPMLGG
jgi:putative transposase